MTLKEKLEDWKKKAQPPSHARTVTAQSLLKEIVISQEREVRLITALERCREQRDSAIKCIWEGHPVPEVDTVAPDAELMEILEGK